MKTAHQFAQELLQYSNNPIGFIDPRDGRLMEPAVSIVNGRDEDGERYTVLEIGEAKARSSSRRARKSVTTF